MARHRPSRYTQPTDGTPDDQENRVAQKLGGKRVAGSGSSIYSKGDVRDVDAECAGEAIEFLVECKKTEKASLSVKWDWLRKIAAEANAQQKEPALAIEIQGGKGDPLCDRNWIAVPLRVFERLTR